MHLVFLTPEPAPPGGGTSFNDGLLPALRALGHTVDAGPALPEGATPIIDGLALPDLEPQIEALAAQDAVVIVHHTSAKAGRDEAGREAVRAVERRMLPRLRRVIATSPAVAERLAQDYGVANPILLPPGLPDLPHSLGSGGPGCHILSAGVLTPRKGHDRLLRALAPLFDLDWTLTIAGDAARDPVHATGLAALVEELGLAKRVTLLPGPDVDALEPEWARADLFALASSWEGHPAGVAEALRRGIPVVAWAVGGVPAMVPQAAGMVCSPEDAPTFSKCLRRAIYDDALRAAMAEGAWEAGAALPGWPQQALAFQAILEG